MWKLWNKLFGWQYVWVKFDGRPRVVRVKKQPNGEWMGKISWRTFWIDNEHSMSGGSHYLTQWMWLTKKPEAVDTGRIE